MDLGLVFSSDGGLESSGLVVLEDDKNLQTVDNIVPLVRTDKVDEALRSRSRTALSSTLTTDDLRMLNSKVDNDRQDPDEVAKEYLQSKGLI